VGNSRIINVGLQGWGKIKVSPTGQKEIHVPKPGAAFASFWGLSTSPLKNVEQIGRIKSS